MVKKVRESLAKKRSTPQRGSSRASDDRSGDTAGAGKKFGFREKALLDRLGKLLKERRPNLTRDLAETVEKAVPAEDLPDWIWSAYRRGILPIHSFFIRLLGQHLVSQSPQSVADILQETSKANPIQLFPGVDARSFEILQQACQAGRLDELELMASAFPVDVAGATWAARAIALFVDAPDEGFSQSRIVPLSEEQCAAGFSGPKSTFTVHPIRVPPEVFVSGNSDSPDLWNLRSAMGGFSAHALGKPSYIQGGDVDREGFVLQADGEFSDLGLGDSGQMYVFVEGAHWDCH